jgi:hypothetical protein
MTGYYTMKPMGYCNSSFVVGRIVGVGQTIDAELWGLPSCWSSWKGLCVIEALSLATNKRELTRDPSIRATY